MYISPALRNTQVRSARVLLLASADSVAGKVFPVEAITSYRQTATLGHRPLRKRRINGSKPSFPQYYPRDHRSRYHQVDEYV